MEIKTNESLSFGTESIRKKTTVETILLGIAFIFMIVVTIICSYALFENVKLRLICSEVNSLHSTSNGIKADEYNKLVDKIDSEGYTLTYAIEKNSKIISEKSGKIDGTVPLADSDTLVLTFTPKVNDNSTSIMMIKQHLHVNIEE